MGCSRRSATGTDPLRRRWPEPAPLQAVECPPPGFIERRAACEAGGFTWHEHALSELLNGLDYPECAQTGFSRVNQLGNS